MPDQGIAMFPNVERVMRADFTLSSGISSSVCNMEIQPQLGTITSDPGTLTFLFGSVRIDFPDCKIATATYQRTPDGLFTVGLSIIDRRWKWEFNSISGHYNKRLPDGTLDSKFEKTPHELATLLLEAMKETGFDVGELPNDAKLRPLVEWEYANPAQELARLCDELSCRIVLRLNNTVKICRVGIGGDLTFDTETTDIAQAIDPKIEPDGLTLVCGKTIYEASLPLEAVGMDTDGSIVPIDKLSYKPADGWEYSVPGFFGGVTSGFKRDLAIATVYRMYRVKDSFTYTSIPGYEGDALIDRWRVLPLEDRRSEKVLEQGVTERPPAYVEGTFFKMELDYENSAAETQWTDDFSLDVERGIVTFSSYVYKINPGIFDVIKPCDDLVLKTGASLRDKTNGSWDRWTQDLPNPSGSSGVGYRFLLHDEIVLRYKEDGTPANMGEVVEESTYWLNAANLEYFSKQPKQVTYRGLIPLDPDGAIAQVQWSVGTPFAMTRASRNNEFSNVVPGFTERRMLEQTRLDRLREVAQLVNSARASK